MIRLFSQSSEGYVLSAFYVVVDDLKDWHPYYPSSDVITFDQYRALLPGDRMTRTRVVNLCRSYRYLSRGYYTSLLAEARGHHVFPSVAVINDLSLRSLYFLELNSLHRNLEKTLASICGTQEKVFRFYCFFGQTEMAVLGTLGRKLFERFSCPILQVDLVKRKTWQLEKVTARGLKHLNEQQQTFFAEAFEHFSRNMWRKPRARKQYRYDLAILVNEQEALPPSNKTALNRLIKAARHHSMDAEVIGRQDYYRLAEFDALMIRETTAIDHHTYRFAKKAEAEGMVVIDDSSSILRCTNKIYLADLLANNKVPIPRTVILASHSAEELEQCAKQLGFPLVLKIPDGSFSRGVVRVSDMEELKTQAKTLMAKSALLIAQEFMYTDYDWRIGVLNNQPLFACRYYMVRNHWQIYQHNNKRISSGGFDTLPIDEVPGAVLTAAIHATRLIGNSLYGVDLKQKGDKAVVIEVNDNPNIDAGIEDRHLGQTLYDRIAAEFVRRIEHRESH